jgi:hypothetical protein
MFSKPVLFGLLAFACVAAAGGGAYLASRPAVPATVAVSQLGTPPADAVKPGVEETEAVVTEEAEPAPAAGPASAGRSNIAPVAPVRKRPASAPPVAAARPATRPSPAPARTTPAASPRPESARNGNDGWSGLEKPWPSRDTTESRERDTAASPPEPAPVLEPAPAPPETPAAPVRRLEELVVSADSVIGLQMESDVSSERARVEDRVEARLTRDVKVGNDVAIPAGARAIGSITMVERGGKVREKARLGIRFHTLVLDDGTEVPVRTETVFREGDSPARESAAKIGGAAVGGAILGAIFGGKKGAVLGGAAGAAGGTAATMAGDRNPATLPAGTTLTVRLSEPATVTVEREQ